MIASTFGRLAALVITMGLIYNAMPPHRQNWKWMSLFWINCWLFQLPKATVQATLGSVAYNSRLIPGAQGQNQALFISQATAFAVLIFAPVGSILTKYIGAPISLYLQKLDEEASWDSANFQSKALDSGKDLVTDHGGEMNSTFEVETPRALEDDIEGDVELK